ncbi:hypothetical protein EJ08DRAFT_650554 [Tothia fuscella]|uniref:B30.2/SPRY domain-containing protein n=1 Tax=Tothia fuscella TaxID=1048955 RepID=A0A9P4TXZ3_9PEZI|nr:hypothetical protein EJ08DRAFT_650554 [Tothia fuscella]
MTHGCDATSSATEDICFGDIVGCGVDFEKEIIFFTKNGKRLMNQAFTGVMGRLFPTVSSNVKIAVSTNFGRAGFKWEPGNTLDFDSDVLGG